MKQKSDSLPGQPDLMWTKGWRKYKQKTFREPFLPNSEKLISGIPADVLNCKVPFPLKTLELFIHCSTLLCHQRSSSGELQPSAHFGTIHYRCSRQSRCGWLLSLGVSISRFIMRRKCIFPWSQAGLPPNDRGCSRDNLQSLLPTTQQTAPDPASFLKSTKQCEATVSFFPPWLEMVEMFITQWEVVCETGVLFPSR